MALRLSNLRKVFNLSQFEYDVFLICLAPALDLRYERLYAYLQDDITRKRPGVNLALTLLRDPGRKHLDLLPRFVDSAPLIQNHLVEFHNETGTGKSNLLSRSLQIDPAITTWLLGSYQPRAELAEFSVYVHPDR